MDPISLSLAIAPLVLSSAKILAGIRSIRHKYKTAQNAVTTTQTECEVMHVALCEVQALVQKNRLELTIRLQSQNSVGEAFDKVLTGCRITLDSLSLELEGILKSTKNGKKENKSMGYLSKAQYVWKNGTMEELMEQMRSQRNHVQFLITVLQSGAQAEILKLVQQNTHSIQNLLNKAKSIRSSQGFDDTESVFTTVKSVTQDPFGDSYEEQLHQSPAYRRAQAAAAEDLLAAKLELLEEKYNLEEKLDELHATVAFKDEALISKDEALMAKNAVLDSKDKAIDSKDKSLGLLDQMLSTKQRDNQTLQQENLSITAAFDKLTIDFDVFKAEKRAEKPTDSPGINEVVQKIHRRATNQTVEAAEDDKEQVLEELKTNGFTWQSVWAFNWAAVNGKVGPFRLGEYSSSFKDPITHMNYLHTASAHGHLELVKYLLSKNFGQNLSFDWSKMGKASHKEIEKCFNVDERTTGENGFTAIQLASQEGHLAIVEALHLAGANINAAAKGLNGVTALQAAAACGHTGIVAYLLEFGASMENPLSMSSITVSGESQEGQTRRSPALQAAEAGGYTEIIQMLREEEGRQKGDPLRSAVQNGDVELSKVLWGLEVDRSRSQHIFSVAVKKGDLALVKALADAGCSGNNGISFLTNCFKHGNTELLRYLLRRYHSKNAHANTASAALEKAVLREDLTLIEVFLSEGIRIICGTNVPTSLDFAIAKGNVEILSRLLISASEVDRSYQDCSGAYEHALVSARRHSQSALLLPILESSDFGKAKGESDLLRIYIVFMH